MNTWVLGASIAAALIAVSLGILLVRMLGYRRPAAADEALSEISLSRYQPMAQLMAGDDLQFLSGQPGVTRVQRQRFKRNRRRIFRLYLHELTADFQSLHRKAREIVAESPEGHGALVGSVLRLQVDFWRFLALIELQLVLDQIGVGAVDSRRLLETINALHASVSRASSSPGPVMV
jgi:hypothetical protein